MSSPPPSLPSSQSQSQSQSQCQSQERRGDSISEADWWRLSTSARTEPRPRPAADSLTSIPSLSALHAETLSSQTQKDALSSVLSAGPSLEAAPLSLIATLDVRLRSLILSMAHYSRANPSPPEQQVVHAIHAASEAHKTDMTRLLSAAAHLSISKDGNEPDHFRGTTLDLDEFDQLTAGLRSHMSEPLPPCQVNQPTLPPPDPFPHPPMRQLNDSGHAPLRRAPSTVAAGTARAPAAASFRTVRGWEEETKESRGGDKAASDIWMRDEEKDGVEEIAAPTNKRKRGAQLWGDDDDGGSAGGRRDVDGRYGGRGRGRRGRRDEQEYGDEEEKSFVTGSDESKQPFMSGTTALALDAAKRGQLGAGGQSAQRAASGARPSGLANSKRKFAPPRSINAVPELAEAVPPMVRAALAGPPTADSYSETNPIIVEKLKGHDPKLVEQVMREALDNSTVNWNDIAGLVHAKQAVTEAVVWPMKQPELFKGPRAPPKGMLLFGPPGTGKCFARGTRLRLYTGDTVAVEDVVGGEQLMGDDGLPRIVTPGSLTHAVDTLYRVSPVWDGANSFTVNGAHILVLVNNVKPHVEKRSDGESDVWEVMQWGMTTDNHMSQWSRTFWSEALAQAELDAIFAAGWEPVEWEPTVKEFLDAPVETRLSCQLVACKAVTFTNPLLPSLLHVLTLVLGVAPSPAQHHYMSWWLGIWLTNGLSRCASVSQGGADTSDSYPHHHIFLRLKDDYERLFDEAVDTLSEQTSTVGWLAWRFNYGLDSVAGRVLCSYGLIANNHLPRALICDTLDVRRRLLAGIIDGHGHNSRIYDEYEVSAEDRHIIEGCKELAATLGLRNSAIVQRTTTIDQHTGEPYAGHCFTISGDMWAVVQYCVATNKQRPQPSVVKRNDSRYYGFTITELPAGEYFGFAVHGGINRRFLIDDYTITHNTMIGKAIAKEAGAKFFAISASSLLSKWHGESEKLVRTLFAVARIYQPSVIFVDEIDSLLSQRGDSDAEASRRIKTELLVQMDGAANGTQESGRLLVLGATNRPQDLDEAARRRMEKRLYIPLPNRAARVELITHQLRQLDVINCNKHTLTPQHIDRIAQLTHGYSGHDLANLCREASMVPMRTVYGRMVASLPEGGGPPTIEESEVPALELEHFIDMLERVKSSVDSAVLKAYHEWNKKYGSFPSVVVDEE